MARALFIAFFALILVISFGKHLKEDIKKENTTELSEVQYPQTYNEVLSLRQNARSQILPEKRDEDYSKLYCPVNPFGFPIVYNCQRCIADIDCGDKKICCIHAAPIIFDRCCINYKD